jgi:hypothetical protein
MVFAPFVLCLNSRDFSSITTFRYRKKGTDSCQFRVNWQSILDCMLYLHFLMNILPPNGLPGLRLGQAS